MTDPATPFTIGQAQITAGERRSVDLHIANLYTSAPVSLPVIVQRGLDAGPTLFVSAALHGDEIIGVEIIRRLLKIPVLQQHLRGTLLAVPVVNVMAFLQGSRYLPDRRDLNRSFPGSESGSLAARLAHVFLSQVVERSDYGIDLHTGAIHRPNLPQIRTDLRNPVNQRLAQAFGAPLFLNSKPAAGTLREYTTRRDIPVILYESSEALRFDETAIRIGVQGVLNVMREIGMLPKLPESLMRSPPPVLAKSSRWARSPSSGILRAQVALGDHVGSGQTLGIVGDPFGGVDTPILAPRDGLVIGRLSLPLVHEGDAVFHIAEVADPRLASMAFSQLEAITRDIESDEPPIV
ncbi:succinylglutamate desuccinylase/aspartoacylase family protein [Hydrocarboniphaga sp.]|uniref:succinylglutamate desuccinylase/aspartoacylase family protein n=1 Tax=Hydrocarboniphaga sp. TaxID=2033016 RepID=UPI003D0D91CC